MLAALKQPAKLSESQEWLAIDEAAALTGESVRQWRRRAVWEARLARQRGRESLAIKVKAAWHVARSIDPQLTKFPSKATREERDRPGLMLKYPAHAVDDAYRKAHWLKLWRSRCDRAGPGATEIPLAAEVLAEARRIEGDGFSIGQRSLQRWHQLYKRTGVEGLIDRRCAPSTGDGGGEGPRDPAAVEWFYSLYRTENKLSASLCHEATVRAARTNGWTWPSSVASTTRWLREHDDRSLTFLLRHGVDRWARKYMSYLEVAYEAIGPGDLYVCDHHQCDFWVTYKGKQIRPWLTAIQDCYTRCITGWHLGPAPHTDAILCAMRRAFRDWAIPVKMRIDNGKDFCAKPLTGVTKAQRDQLRRQLGRNWQRIIQRSAPEDSPVDSRWLGICGELSIDLIYAIPYAAWSKGTVERFFGTVEGRHGKTYVTYCGDSTVNRPECLADIKRGYSAAQRRQLKKLHGEDWRRHALLKFIDQADIPTLEESRARLSDWMETYHRSPHRGLQGATPLAMWQTATSLRRAVEDDLMCLMETRGVYRVGGNGVRVTVGAAAIGYGKSSAAIKRHVGRDVLILLNPDDVSHVWAFTPDRDKRKPIGRLDANERIVPGTCADDAREAIAAQMRERKVLRSAKRTSANRTRTQVQRINENSRAKLAELRATGTDPADQQPVIVPVQTGFEGGSRPGQGGFEPEPYCPAEPGDLEDLFDDRPVDDVESEDMDDLSDLFVEDESTEESGDDLEDLL